MAAPAAEAWAYTPPLSLWELVEQNVCPEEQEEIRSMLGTSLIETTLDLHNEVNMLLDIWRDYQEETEAKCNNMRVLPEPPHVRERLIQEICFLADGVREKSARKGMNATTLLSRHNSQVLDYAEETKRSGSSLGSARPLSARSSDGRQTPLSPSDHASSRSALSSTMSEEVSSATDKLNYLHFEEVCNRLRETLAEEMEQLELDVVFLHSCLDDAADFRCHGGTPGLSREPTITELREERSMLEKDLLSADSLPSTPSVNKPHFLPNSAVPDIKLQQLGPVKPRLRSAQNTSNTLPLKASHSVVPPSLSLHSESASTDGSHSHTKPDPCATRGDTSQAYGTDTQTTIPGYCQNTEKEVSRAGYYHNPTGKDNTKTHEKARCHPKRTPSAARVKVVPVGSVLGPRADSAGSRSFMPTPPPEEDKPNTPRPGSAQRFRKMVMQYREST